MALLPGARRRPRARDEEAEDAWRRLTARCRCAPTRTSCARATASASWRSEAGLRLVDQTKLVTAVSELARNTVVHGGGGDDDRRASSSDGGRDRACGRSSRDEGPGIADIEQALRDGFTTGERPRPRLRRRQAPRPRVRRPHRARRRARPCGWSRGADGTRAPARSTTPAASRPRAAPPRRSPPSSASTSSAAARRRSSSPSWPPTSSATPAAARSSLRAAPDDGAGARRRSPGTAARASATSRARARDGFSTAGGAGHRARARSAACPTTFDLQTARRAGHGGRRARSARAARTRPRSTGSALAMARRGRPAATPGRTSRDGRPRDDPARRRPRPRRRGRARGRRAAVRELRAGLTPEALLERMHARAAPDARRRRRGRAARPARPARCASPAIGNIAATIVDGATTRSLASMNGHARPSRHALPRATTTRSRPAALLVMHSDGCRGGWDLSRLPGRARRDPLVIAVAADPRLRARPRRRQRRRRPHGSGRA